MLGRLFGAVKHLLTAKDGETYTPARVYWCLAALTQIGLSIWDSVGLAHPFNSTDFGAGMAAILAAGGLGVWMTRKSEPDE